MENLSRVKVALREGRQTFGLWQMIPGANVSRCLARAGADWVCVDCEHGNMDGKDTLHMPMDGMKDRHPGRES